YQRARSTRSWAATIGVDTLTTTGESDHALIAGCVNGDQQAWIELLDRYKRQIYGVTVRFGFDVEDRHDVFQAVCLETLKSLSSLRNASSLRYWILTITVRQCSLLLKRKRQERGRDWSGLPICRPRQDTGVNCSLGPAAEIEHGIRKSSDTSREPPLRSSPVVPGRP